MTATHSSASISHATSILQAWQSRDAGRLRTALDLALAPPDTDDFSPGELERSELLQAVAREIHSHFVPQPDLRATEQITVCIGLLQHLVGQDTKPAAPPHSVGAASPAI